MYNLREYPEIDDAFGHWLAGFIDGEGCFGVTGRRPQNPVLAFGIRLRSDDLQILEEIARRTGLGNVRPRLASTNGHPVAEWTITRRSECARLIELLRRYPLRAKKARDLEHWAHAYRVWLETVRPRRRGRSARDWSAVWDVIDVLRSDRQYRPWDVADPTVGHDGHDAQLRF